LELPAVNFFQWDQCRKYLPNNWTTIAGYSWPLPLPENPPVLPAISESKDSSPDAFSLIFLASLNSRKAAQAASLYDPDAVRTWVNETLNGVSSIQNGYDTLFNNLPSEIVFSLTKARVNNDIHFLTWKAGPLTGETTLVLKNGKIVQDYTFIS
jgi:hypothetical protein